MKKSIIKKKDTYKSLIILVLIFLVLLTYWSNINTFNINDDVYFLDLPKGEATLIKQSFNENNILIDTGEDGYDDIILFLKSVGIKRLDAIFISHGDSDHNGMLGEICKEFKIGIVYYSIYDEVTPLLIPKDVNKMSIMFGDVIKLGNCVFEIISPTKKYSSKNNNSLVMYATIFSKTYLFTGDIEQEAEYKLLNIGMIDILKVAHHGSKTSTSDEFLAKIKYQYAICMNGYRNQFSFPAVQTKSKLGESLLVTSETTTIVIRHNRINNKYHIYILKIES